MRAVFQHQPEVAHVYLGSKRHMMQRIFNDENEPFWRSAKQIELGRDRARALFAAFIERAVRAHRALRSRRRRSTRSSRSTGGHPYATQELCYFAWQETAPEERATRPTSTPR